MNINEIRVLIVEPQKVPREAWIEDTLEAKQQIVGGYIEMTTPLLHDDTAVIICNEEGKLNGLPINRLLETKEGDVYDVLCGTFIVLDAPADSDDFGSLSDEQVDKYYAMYY